MQKFARSSFAILSLIAGGTALAADAPPALDRVSLKTVDPLAHAQSATLSNGDLTPMADRVVVRKAQRRMYLMRGESVLRSYRIALGLNPSGQKERAGDFRTPEGRYFLTRRNPRSDYFLSIQVSYPNQKDILRARRMHWNVGGSIMVHGLPNVLHRSPEYYDGQDWTDGCIAVTNSEMIEIWLMTAQNTPIDILP
jgi:murein L,D-transpeptidase YafK